MAPSGAIFFSNDISSELLDVEPMKDRPFNYNRAFDRNIGWLTDWEQQSLRHKTVAIAGLGGVGGAHALALARLGISGFHIADLDTFDLVNINRQAGAMMSTIGRPKTEVVAEMIHDINPEARVTCLGSGVSPANIDQFLAGADLFVDGFDFFVLGIRRQVFARAYELGIPAITAAPIGMGVGWLIFLPQKMSFEQYFGLEGHDEAEQYLRFLMGVAPRGLHRPYLVDPTRVDLANKRGPSTGAACQLCAGVVATEALKLLLRRGRVKAAPYHQHFDAYRGRFAVTRLPFGAAGPLQTAKRAIARTMYRKMAALPGRTVDSSQPTTMMDEILSLARWAPSGDNSQPWRFSSIEADRVTVDFAVEQGNVYEYRDGQPTILSSGMLLESLRLAASRWGKRTSWRLISLPNLERVEAPSKERRTIRAMVVFTDDPDVRVDPLAAELTRRSVDRRSFKSRRLSAAEKTALEECMSGSLRLDWYESAGDRLRLARLGATATDIRLRMHETFPIHNAVVDWSKDSSRTGIPALALGLPSTTRAMMRWASRDWSRMQMLNRIGGTVTAGLQMDVVPGVRSAAVFAIRFAGQIAAADRPQALLEAGAAIQRFWLTASRLGLVLHPAIATLAFAYYGASGARFTTDPHLLDKAAKLATGLREALRPDGRDDVIFLGRIGEPLSPAHGPRSIRKPLSELLD